MWVAVEETSRAYTVWLFLGSCEQMSVHPREDINDRFKKKKFPPESKLLRLCIFPSHSQDHEWSTSFVPSYLFSRPSVCRSIRGCVVLVWGMVWQKSLSCLPFGSLPVKTSEEIIGSRAPLREWPHTVRTPESHPSVVCCPGHWSSSHSLPAQLAPSCWLF